MVVCEYSSDEFDIGHCPIKPYISDLALGWKLQLTMHVLLILVYSIYEYRHASMTL